MSDRRIPNDDPDPGLLPELLGYQLRRAQIAAFQHFAATVGEATGLRPGWFGLLAIVARNEGLSQVRLARTLGTDGSTMVAMIDRLEKGGWVSRVRSATDRRTHALHLTEAGRALLDEATVAVREHEAAFAAPLEPWERNELLRLLAKLNGA